MNPSYGKYQVLEQVGEGGFGRVYRALDPLLKREVAIKTCTLREPEMRARFVREAEIVARLKHRNIVTVYDFGVEDGEPYLVQEFLGGADLQTILDSGANIDLPTRVAWLRQIADGLLAAHAQNVIHRDIKPSNIRIEADGDVRIMDFGIAKLLEAEQQFTQTGMSIGTTGYLAPEQLAGGDIDHRADIFSFGVLAYELLAGTRPFAADSVTAVLYRIAHEDPTPLGEMVPGLPVSLTRCIERCLEKDRNRRWATFGPVTGELERVQQELESGGGAVPDAPAAGPGTTGEHIAGTERRRLTPAYAGLAVFTLVAALAGVLMVSRTGWGGSGTANGPTIPIDGGLAETGAAGDEPAPAVPPGPVDASADAPDEPATDGEQQAAGGVASPVATNGTATPGTGTGGGEPVVTPPADGGAAVPPPPPAPPPPPPVAPQPSPAALEASRLVVLVDAPDVTVHDAAESRVLEELRGEGFSVVDAAMVEGAGGGAAPAPNAMAGLGRTHGAGYVVFITATAAAEPSVGGMYTGSATVQLRIYDAAAGELAATRRGTVGSGGVPGEIAATADAARMNATGAAAYRAVRAALRDLR